jgi:hypothetical protein
MGIDYISPAPYGAGKNPEKGLIMEKLTVSVQVRHGLIVLSTIIDGKPFIKCYDDINGIKKAKEHYKTILPARPEKIIFKRSY